MFSAQSGMDTEERPARPAWADSGQNFRTSGMPRLGPQAERSSAWVNRDGEVQAPTQREVGNDAVSSETAVWYTYLSSTGSWEFVLVRIRRRQWGLVG